VAASRTRASPRTGPGSTGFRPYHAKPGGVGTHIRSASVRRRSAWATCPGWDAKFCSSHGSAVRSYSSSSPVAPAELARPGGGCGVQRNHNRYGPGHRSHERAVPHIVHAVRTHTPKRRPMLRGDRGPRPSTPMGTSHRRVPLRHGHHRPTPRGFGTPDTGHPDSTLPIPEHRVARPSPERQHRKRQLQISYAAPSSPASGARRNPPTEASRTGREVRGRVRLVCRIELGDHRLEPIETFAHLLNQHLGGSRLAHPPN